MRPASPAACGTRRKSGPEGRHWGIQRRTPGPPEDATIIDSHAHVCSDRFDGDRAQVLARAWEAGLKLIVEVGTGLASSRAAVALAETDARLRATVGIHPHRAAEASSEDLAELERLAGHERVVAIGECGLDRGPHNHAPPALQESLLRAHLALARRVDLPLVFHVRDAFPAFFRVLEDERERGPLRGIVHCFGGGPDEARRSLDLGLYVSFSGIVTFANAPLVRAAAAVTPLDRTLVETDCPYLAPEPHRGQRNEPAHVTHTAARLALLHGLTPDAFAQRVSAATLAAYALCEEDLS